MVKSGGASVTRSGVKFNLEPVYKKSIEQKLTKNACNEPQNRQITTELDCQNFGVGIYTCKQKNCSQKGLLRVSKTFSKHIISHRLESDVQVTCILSQFF